MLGVIVKTVVLLLVMTAAVAQEAQLPRDQQAFHDGHVLANYTSAIAEAAGFVAMLKLECLNQEGINIAWIKIDGALLIASTYEKADYPEDHIATVLQDIGEENTQRALEMIIKYRIENGPGPVPDYVLIMKK